MNFLNRLIMLVISLLLLVVPVLLLLVALGFIAPQLAEQYTGYSVVVDFIGGLSLASVGPQARIIAAVIGVLVVLVALLLIMRELTFGRVIARNTIVDDSPGAETLITASAVRALSEGAAREMGAEAPSISLAEGKPAYGIRCGIEVPSSSNYTELAARVRENIRKALENQNVKVKDVEVTIRKVAS
ncbi:hypothetical protein BH18ACT10_BH18ACT10_11030 [soil metagenome]|nr:hypothetical protein [Rubrobacter sp.]